MMKGLMGCCLNHETTLDHIRAKANSTEDELNELKAWRTVMEKKLALSEKARGEWENQTELWKQVLEDKEKEIIDTKDQLCQVKEEAIREYCDSDALLAELRGSFAKGFDDALCQVKTSYPDLDVSHVSIEAPNQTSIQPVLSESTDDLFTDDAPGDLRDDGKSTQVKSQAKIVKDNTRHPKEPMFEEKNEAPVQQYIYIYIFG